MFLSVSGKTDFSRSRFGGDAYFSGSILSGGAIFHKAHFVGRAYFDGVTFGASAQEVVTFQDSDFKEPATFLDARFPGRYPGLLGMVLNERTIFTADPAHWPKGAQADPAEAKASCAAIRHNLGKQGLPEAEHFFYRREMGFAGKSGPVWQRPPYWLFGWFSDYGYSILTPFLWLLLLIVLGAYVLAWGLAGGVLALSFEQGLGLSFANVFNFLGFHRAFLEADFTQNLPQWLKVVSAFQTIFGVVLLFFLGLGLRTRFRLR